MTEVLLTAGIHRMLPATCSFPLISSRKLQAIALIFTTRLRLSHTNLYEYIPAGNMNLSDVTWPVLKRKTTFHKGPHAD